MAASTCLAQESSPAPESDEAIRTAVRDLESADFQTREDATQRLWKIGKPALPAIEAALDSPRLEVRRRAGWLLERVLFEITPQSPPEIVSAVRAWNLAPGERQQVVDDLTRLGAPALPVLYGFLRLTKDEVLRRKLEDAIQQVRRKEVQPALEAGDLKRVEELLRATRAYDRNAMRDYATFFLLTGRLDEEIERVRADALQSEDDRVRELLMYCLRAAGRHEDAMRVARTVPTRVWLDGLQVETGRWAELAASGATWPMNRSDRVRPGWNYRPVRDKGFMAACLRLAGRHSDCDRVLAEIARDARNLEPLVKWYDLRAWSTMLLINERPTASVDILADHAAKSYVDRAMAIKVLCLQERYATAFDLAELAIPDASQRAKVAVEYAKQLAGLGERERAAKLLVEMIDKAADKRSPATRSLVRTLVQIGHVSGGLKFLARRLEAAVTDSEQNSELSAVYTSPAYYGRPPNVPGWLSPTANQLEIRRLWGMLPECFAEDPTDWQLARLRHFIGLPVEQDWNKEDRLETADQLTKVAREQGGELLPSRLRSIAYALIRLREGDRARQLLTEAIGLTDTSEPVQLYADSLALDARWAEAADWYTRLTEQVPQSSFYEYAVGYCRHKSGDAEGEALMNRACLPFLSRNSDRNRAIDHRVRDRNWMDAKVRLAQLAFNTHAFGEHHILNAAGTLGNSVSKSNPRQAVQMWELLQLALTSPSILRYVTAFEQVLMTQETLQRVKARDLSRRGRIPELLSAIEASRRTLPGSILIAVERVPTLREAGHTAEADRLIEQIAAVNRQVLEQYPNSHRHHHRLARLSSELGWQPEEGLKHARAAAELVPENSAYQKTLDKLQADSDE